MLVKIISEKNVKALIKKEIAPQVSEIYRQMDKYQEINLKRGL